MATVTFPVKIGLDLVLLIADQTLIDMSRQRDSTATELASRTVRTTEHAAAKVQAKLGDVGSYDDTDQTLGDLAALDLGVRLALLRYSQVYTLTLTEDGRSYIGDIREELDEEADTRRQEAGTPVLKSRENTTFNLRHEGDDWPDKDDSDAP